MSDPQIEYCVRETLRTLGPLTQFGLVAGTARLSGAPLTECTRAVEHMQLSRSLQYDPSSRRYSLA